MLRATNLEYEMADRSRAIACGGIGMMFQMLDRLGLRERIDTLLRILKVRLPYFESDHILNIVLNILASWLAGPASRISSCGETTRTT